jgi:hypothetical protein
MNKMTQTKTKRKKYAFNPEVRRMIDESREKDKINLKEKAIEEGINYLKDNDKVIYQDYDGFKIPDNLIREKDNWVAIKKAVDTYADEVDKFHSKLIDPKVISRWGKTEDERKAITDFILTHIRYFRRGLV